MWCSTLGCIVTLTLSLLAVPRTAEAQPVAPTYRVGFLHPGALTPERARNLDTLRQGLRDLGYVEGQNLTLVYRWAEGREERLPDLAAELVRLPVDVLVAVSPSAVRAASNATTTLPIVAHDLETDPVASGRVASLARPGGTSPGCSSISRTSLANGSSCSKKSCRSSPTSQSSGIPGLVRSSCARSRLQPRP